MTHSKLDECNGKMVDGSYRYHMTPDPPYLLGCFKGQPGSYTAKHRKPLAACPASGLVNEYVVGAEATEEQLLAFRCVCPLKTLTCSHIFRCIHSIHR